MGKIFILSTRLATFLILHAVGAGLATPSVLIIRPSTRDVLWLPTDNQTFYSLKTGVINNLELNTSSTFRYPVYITVSPCNQNIRWAFYQIGPGGDTIILEESNSSDDMKTFSVTVVKQYRYMLELSSNGGGSVAVSVRGEAPRQVRLRLRSRSKRRLIANWEPSPIDPQKTTYCVVVSHLKNYTSLCAAQNDLQKNRFKNQQINYYDSNQSLKNNSEIPEDIDNKINGNFDLYNAYEEITKISNRKKKKSRRTKVTGGDPIVACVGEKNHHFIENLDVTKLVWVSIFGYWEDRQTQLLASSTFRRKNTTPRRLSENTTHTVELRDKTIFYFKTHSSFSGIWISISTCGIAFDVEVILKGRRLYVARNIETHIKFYAAASGIVSSSQETSGESSSSLQFDSSSEEASVRYVVKVIPNKSYKGPSFIEISASTSRWGINTPELPSDGSVVREVRTRRGCQSIDIAFLPATHTYADFIKYCIMVKEISSSDNRSCLMLKDNLVDGSSSCVNHVQRQSRAIVQKISGLKSATTYSVQVIALNKGSVVPYENLVVETNTFCKGK